MQGLYPRPKDVSELEQSFHSPVFQAIQGLLRGIYPAFSLNHDARRTAFVESLPRQAVINCLFQFLALIMELVKCLLVLVVATRIDVQLHDEMISGSKRWVQAETRSACTER